METNTAIDRPRFQKDRSEIRGAPKTDTYTPVQRITEIPIPLCARQTDLFFGKTEYDETGNPVPEKPHMRTRRELICIEICSSCPYRKKCLAKALTYSQYDDTTGVFGGYTVKGRRRLRSWIWTQRLPHIEMNEELFWSIELYEGNKSQGDILKWLKEQCVRA